MGNRDRNRRGGSVETPDASQLDAENGAAAVDAENVDVDTSENTSSDAENVDVDTSENSAENSAENTSSTDDTSADDDDDTSENVDQTDQLTPAVAALETAWRETAAGAAAAALSTSSPYVALSAVELDRPVSAFRLVASLTKPAERLPIVRGIAESLSAVFLAERNIDAMGASADIRAALDDLAAAKKVATLVDQTRENATRWLVATLAAAELDRTTTDDEKVIGRTIPLDDPTFSTLAEKVWSTLNRRGAGRGASTSSTPRGPRAVGEPLVPIIAAAVAAGGGFASLADLKSQRGKGGGAIDNIFTGKTGSKTLAAAGLVATEKDGKKGFATR